MVKLARRLHRWSREGSPVTLRQFLTAYTILFALVTLALVGEGLLARANRHRIDDQQKNRAASCATTYDSIQDVALFFFPPPEQRTGRQRRIATRLDRFIDRRIANCKRQVNGKHPARAVTSTP